MELPFCDISLFKERKRVKVITRLLIYFNGNAMGTSSVRKQNFSGGGGSDSLNEGLNEKLENAAPVIDSVMRFFLPLLPNGSVKTPVYCAASELIRFAYAIQEQGLEKAAVSTGIRITKEYLIPQVANAAWNHVDSYLVKNNLQYPTNKYAEMAFKRTLIEVMNKGVDAIAERTE